MALLERYLGELEQLKTETAQASLTNVPDAAGTAFGFGRAVGRQEGIELARSRLDTLLSEAEENTDKAGAKSEPRHGRRT